MHGLQLCRLSDKMLHIVGIIQELDPTGTCIGTADILVKPIKSRVNGFEGDISQYTDLNSADSSEKTRSIVDIVQGLGPTGQVLARGVPSVPHSSTEARGKLRRIVEII